MKDMSKWSVAGVSAALLAVGGAPLMAQDYSGAFTFGYSNGSIGGSGGPGSTDISALTLHGNITVQFPDGFRFGARHTYVSPDIEGLPFDLRLTGTEITAGYVMSNGAWFGVFSEQIDITANLLMPPMLAIGQHYYGIEGGTNVAGVAVKAFYGSGNDVTSYGVSGRYAADRYVVGGFYTHSDLDDSMMAINADIGSYGVGGSYQATQQIAVFGGLANSSLSSFGTDIADILDYGIGVSYDLTSMTNLPLFASLEYSGAKISEPGGSGEFTLDGFTLSVTVPMGQGRSMVPENSVAAAALNPTHSAISQMALMSF